MHTNAFTIDFEDWYQGIELPIAEWGKHERRIEHGFNKVVELLDKQKVKATFFTLGWIAEKYPHLIKQLAAAGHELGSHSYSHEKVYNQTQEVFREEIRRTKQILENLARQKIIAHRSPFFSVTSQCLWALDILAEEGYMIDCSISPIKTWRYGISTCPDEIFRIKENNLIEFPVSRFSFLGKNWAIGGAYFRIFPYSFTSNGITKRTRNNLPNMFYIHPWEYDPAHPRIKFERKAMLTHYARLGKTFPNTEKLLKQFSFTTVSDVVKTYEQQNRIRTVSINVLQD
jgi:polysaccharide deacetylase family protein (PEP-CTERM system associated)